MSLTNRDWHATGSEEAADLEERLRRFDQAWQRGERPAIGDYLPAANACRRAALVELVHIDLEYRVRAGEALRAADYLDRYPELGEEEGVLRSLQATEEELRGQARSRPGAAGRDEEGGQDTGPAGE